MSFGEAMRQIEEFLGLPVGTEFPTTVGYSLPDPDALIVAGKVDPFGYQYSAERDLLCTPA